MWIRKHYVYSIRCWMHYAFEFRSTLSNWSLSQTIIATYTHIYFFWKISAIRKHIVRISNDFQRFTIINVHDLGHSQLLCFTRISIIVRFRNVLWCTVHSFYAGNVRVHQMWKRATQTNNVANVQCLYLWKLMYEYVKRHNRN